LEKPIDPESYATHIDRSEFNANPGKLSLQNKNQGDLSIYQQLMALKITFGASVDRTTQKALTSVTEKD
jgi:hypothetical protein